MKELKKWRMYSALECSDVENIAQVNLQKLLEHAVSNVPYYRKLNIGMLQNSPYEWLQNFPIMRKDNMRVHIDEMIADGYNKERLVICKSSGSSGIQGTTYESKKEQSIHRAIQILFWEWSGYYLGKIYCTDGNDSTYIIEKIKRFFVKNTLYICV